MNTNIVSLSNGEHNRIQQVKVFSQRAYITRVAKAEVVTGLNRLNLEITAFEVDKDTVQARVLGVGEILAVQYQKLPTLEIAQANLRELDAQERELRQQKAQLDNRLKNLQRQQQFLDAVANFAAVQVPREIQTAMPPIEQLQATLQYLDSNGISLLEKVETIQLELETLNEHLKNIQNQLKVLKKDQQQERKVIEILFQSPQAQSLHIEASYGVGRASWQAIYKVDADEAKQFIHLTQFAQITQNTGENWEAVELSVSNAVPLKTGALPELDTWHLHEPVRVRLREHSNDPLRSLGEFDDDLSLGMEDEEAEPQRRVRAAKIAPAAAPTPAPPPQASFAQASVEDKGIHFEYSLPNRVTLLSDNREALLPLRQHHPTAEFFHYAVPHVDKWVYQVCRIKADANLPAGRLNIHSSGQYLGSTYLSEQRPGQEVLVNLGVDRAVRIELQQTSNQLTETFFGKVDRQNIARHIKYLVKLENLKKQAVQVQVLEHIPIADTDRYQVKDLELSPKPVEKDWQQRAGVLRWCIELQADSTQTITISYVLKYPRDNPPEGF